MSHMSANPVPLQYRSLRSVWRAVRHPGLADAGTQYTLQQLYEQFNAKLAELNCNGVTYVDQVYFYGQRMDLFGHRDLNGEHADQLLVTLAHTSLRDATLTWMLQFTVNKENIGTVQQRYVISPLYLGDGVTELPYQYALTVLGSIIDTVETCRPSNPR